MDHIVGGSFEAFVIEELLKRATDSGDRQVTYYYRTRGGSEIDLIIGGFLATYRLKLNMVVLS